MFILLNHRFLQAQNLKKGQRDYTQLNCRMAFKNKVEGQSHNFLNIVNTYQMSLNRVIDAIATSTIAVDAKKIPSIEGVICS